MQNITENPEITIFLQILLSLIIILYIKPSTVLLE